MVVIGLWHIDGLAEPQLASRKFRAGKGTLMTRMIDTVLLALLKGSTGERILVSGFYFASATSSTKARGNDSAATNQGPLCVIDLLGTRGSSDSEAEGLGGGGSGYGHGESDREIIVSASNGFRGIEREKEVGICREMGNQDPVLRRRSSNTHCPLPAGSKGGGRHERLPSPPRYPG